MTESTGASKPRGLHDRFWYVFDIPTIGFLFLFGTFMNSFPLIFYVGGLRNDGALPFGMCFYCAVLAPAALLCLVVLAARIGISWPKHIHHRRKLRTLRLVVIVGLVLYLALPFTMILPPGYKTFTWGFKKHAAVNADIPTIRSWLGTVDPKVCTGYMMLMADLKQADRIDWPEAITRLDPQDVTLTLDGNGHPVIHLGWGGLDVFYGLVVGSENMEIPRTKPRTKQKHISGRVFWDSGEYRLPVAPGAYVWYEIE